MWYKHLYELLFKTEPLFNNALLDWLFPALIVFLLYDFAFGIVGGLYRTGVIRGRHLGSIIHWGIRYVIMWLTIQVLIFIRDNWFLIIGFSIVVVVIFVFIGFIISKLSEN